MAGRCLISTAGPVPAVLAGGPVQLAYGVDDVRSAARRWAVEFGAGPFFLRHNIEVSDVSIAGSVAGLVEPAAGGSSGGFDHSSAYGQWGSLMVELIAVHDPPSLASSGLHHLAYFVESFESAARQLEERGWPQVMVATAGQTRFAFHDARSELGHLIEIYEGSVPLRKFYAMVADAAKGWDGADPVRTL